MKQNKFSMAESKWILENEYPFSRVIKLYDTVSINTETENRVIVFGGRIDNSLQSGAVIAQFDGSWSKLGTDLKFFAQFLFWILIWVADGSRS